jgi:hypothetical protein
MESVYLPTTTSLRCRNAATAKALAKGLCAATQLRKLHFRAINFDADPTRNLAEAVLGMRQLEAVHFQVPAPNCFIAELPNARSHSVCAFMTNANTARSTMLHWGVFLLSWCYS